MNFNFKNKNSIIILLLILLIASVFCFFLMQKKVEPFIQGNDNFNKFKIIGQSLNSNYSDKYLYKLNDNNLVEVDYHYYTYIFSTNILYWILRNSKPFSIDKIKYLLIL